MPSELLHATVNQALAANRNRARTFAAHGMACVGCAMAAFESIEEVARIYRVDPVLFAAELERAPEGTD